MYNPHIYFQSFQLPLQYISFVEHNLNIYWPLLFIRQYQTVEQMTTIHLYFIWIVQKPLYLWITDSLKTKFCYKKHPIISKWKLMKVQQDPPFLSVISSLPIWRPVQGLSVSLTAFRSPTKRNWSMEKIFAR